MQKAEVKRRMQAIGKGLPRTLLTCSFSGFYPTTSRVIGC